jgi:gas vesicle protein
MAEQYDQSRAVWFMAGVAIGATVALLFAPNSGEETRRRLREQAGKGRERLTETGREIAERGREFYDKGRRIADEAAEMFERGRRIVQG